MPLSNLVTNPEKKLKPDSLHGISLILQAVSSSEEVFAADPFPLVDLDSSVGKKNAGRDVF